MSPDHLDRHRMAAQPPGAPSSIEVFAGGGGMALGMRRAGFKHLSLVEWSTAAALVLRQNASEFTWESDCVCEEDVRDALPVLAEMGPVSLIAGGPPCQPFSLAGAGAGHSDERNMFPAALELVRRVMPEYVIFENVPGLLRASFAPYLQYVQDQLRRPDIEPASSDELWNEHHARILKSRGANQYHVFLEQVDAADFGVPQNRKRIFLIAVRVDLGLEADWSGLTRTHSRTSLFRDQWLTGEYWERHGLPSPTQIPSYAASTVRRLRDGLEEDHHAPWRTLRDLLADVPSPYVDHVSEEWPNHKAVPGARIYPGHTGSPIDLPSKTIKAGVHGVAGGEGMVRYADGSVRYLSVREAALVQGFPQRYEFPTSRSRMMGVIGNAVAVDLAAAVGSAVLASYGHREAVPDLSFAGRGARSGVVRADLAFD